MEDLSDFKDDVHKQFGSHHWICHAKYVQIDLSHCSVVKKFIKVELVIFRNPSWSTEDIPDELRMMFINDFEYTNEFVFRSTYNLMYNTPFYLQNWKS